MAGIVGYVSSPSVPAGYAAKLVSLMQDQIRYTGAEQTDSWEHNSFAIARVHHGVVNPSRQPVFGKGPDGSIGMVLDGELFSDRSEGVEYALRMYQEDGTDAFVRLNGSFLIVIYNTDSHELLLVNDRFSSRPLFYAQHSRWLAFAPQLRALLMVPDFPRTLDFRAIQEFFTFQRVLAERTYYRDAQVLPPATILRFRDGSLSQTRYWAPQYKDQRLPTARYVDALSDALKKAVARRSRPPFRAGLLLSAGLDSRAILAALEHPVTTFTLGDSRNTEVTIAQQLAATKGCEHHYLQRDPDHYYRIVEEAVDIGDGMHAYFHAHFLGFITGIKNQADVLLHGHGLDYTFQGLYLPLTLVRMFGRTLTIPRLDPMTPDSLPGKIFRNVHYQFRSGGGRKLFRAVAQDDLRAQMIESVRSVLTSYSEQTTSIHNRWDYFVTHSIFKHFTYLNVSCIRAYMDERTVIFDNDLFDVYLDMPPSLRLGGPVYRKAIRNLSPDLASVPSAKTALRVDLPLNFHLEWALKTGADFLRVGNRILGRWGLSDPASVYTEGSWPNMNELIRQNVKLQRLIRETIRDKRCLDPEIFDVASIEAHLEEHLGGRDLNELLLSLLTFGRWYKKYGP